MCVCVNVSVWVGCSIMYSYKVPALGVKTLISYDQRLQAVLLLFSTNLPIFQFFF